MSDIRREALRQLAIRAIVRDLAGDRELGTLQITPTSVLYAREDFDGREPIYRLTVTVEEVSKPQEG